MTKVKSLGFVLFFPVFVLFTVQCHNNPIEEQIKISQNPPEGEPIEIQWEEKIYWTGTIDEPFDGDSVMVVMDKNIGGVNKVHDKNFFGDIEIEYIRDLTYFTISADKINKLGINWETWRQILLIKLPENSKENVVKVIRHLKKIDGIIAAGPNHIQEPDATIPNDPGYGSQWGLNGPAGIQAPAA